MTGKNLKIFQEPDELARHLKHPSREFVFVEEAEIVGLLEISPDQKDVALYFRGEESSSRYSIPILETETVVALAKQILRCLEPSAIDRDSRILQSLRRIEEKLGTLPDS